MDASVPGDCVGDDVVEISDSGLALISGGDLRLDGFGDEVAAFLVGLWLDSLTELCGGRLALEWRRLRRLLD